MAVTLRHVGIVVQDLPRMAAFYRDRLGFTQEKRALETGNFIDTILGARNVEVTTVKLTSPSGGMIELLHFTSPCDATHEPHKRLFSPGLTHIALTVDNLDHLYEQLCREGTKFVAPPAISADGRAKVAFCCDPEANYLELVEPLYAA